MSDEPERIWAWGAGIQMQGFNSGLWRDDWQEGAEYTEYVPAHWEKRAEAAEAKLAIAVEQAYREGFERAASMTPHVDEVYRQRDRAWRLSKALAELEDKTDA